MHVHRREGGVLDFLHVHEMCMCTGGVGVANFKLCQILCMCMGGVGGGSENRPRPQLADF